MAAGYYVDSAGTTQPCMANAFCPGGGVAGTPSLFSIFVGPRDDYTGQIVACPPGTSTSPPGADPSSENAPSAAFASLAACLVQGGYYIPTDTHAEPSECPAGHYCPGGWPVTRLRDVADTIVECPPHTVSAPRAAQLSDCHISAQHHFALMIDTEAAGHAADVVEPLDDGIAASHGLAWSALRLGGPRDSEQLRRSVVITPSLDVAGAMLISVNASYTAHADDGGPEWRTLYNFDGLEFVIHAAPVNVAGPGGDPLVVHDFAAVRHNNGGSLRCSQGVYLTAKRADKFASWQPDTFAVIDLVIDEHGMVGVPSINGVRFEPVAFDFNSDWVESCTALSFTTDSVLRVGHGAAQGDTFPGVVASVSIDHPPVHG